MYFLAKTEREKCPLSDILDKLTKSFQIRQVCMSLCNDIPYSNFGYGLLSKELAQTCLI